MKRWPKLNSHQLAILRRIGEPGETVSSNEWGLAKTVYALRDRGLVATLKGEKLRWSAEITDAGRLYLEHGCYTSFAKPPSRDSQPDPPHFEQSWFLTFLSPIFACRRMLKRSAVFCEHSERMRTLWVTGL
jgi:hypothetical protein